MTTPAAVRRMPHSEKIERTVLGCMIHLADNYLAPALDTLSETDFHAPIRAQLFGSVRKLHQRGSRVDPAEVAGLLADNPNALAELETLELQLLDIEPYLRRLRALTAARGLARTMLTLASEALEGAEQDPEGFLDQAGQQLAAAMSKRDDAVRIVTMPEAMHGAVARLDQPSVLGVTTGLVDLDKQIGGLKPGFLYVIAGRPGMGKSALAVQCAEAAAKEGMRSAVFSLEMPTEQLADRMLAARSRRSVDDLHSGAMSDEQLQFVVKSAQDLSELPIVFPEGVHTIESIRRTARAMHLRSKLGLLVVDYLQLLRSSQRFGNREQEVAHISRELKLIGMELMIPVVAVAQLNRGVESRGEKRPMLSDLRESGAIEQDADVVLFLYREGYYDSKVDPKVAEIICAKQRGGPVGIVFAHFAPELTRFFDRDRVWT